MLLAREGAATEGRRTCFLVDFEATQLLTAEDEAAGARLDSFLASQLSQVSRTRIQRAIEDGEIVVNDRVVKPSYRLRAGDQIEIDVPEPPPLDLVPEPIPLSIVYEDHDLIVVDKPAGLVVHPGAGVASGTLANALVHHFNELSGRAGAIRPGIVHRLDKETSGLLVVAKNDAAHERLSQQFHDRKVFKSYVALVYGRVPVDRGDIRASIGRSRRNRIRMAVLPAGAGRDAHTIFEVRKRYDGYTLLDVQIKTGRTHQIRVHLAHIGHPVLGDAVYSGGREKSIRDSRMKRGIRSLGRHFLHAAKLEFDHPRSGERMSFASEMPEELEAFLRHLSEAT